MNKTNNSLSKFTSVFHECGKGSVQLMADNTNVNIMININNDKHRNKRTSSHETSHTSMSEILRVSIINNLGISINFVSLLTYNILTNIIISFSK